MKLLRQYWKWLVAAVMCGAVVGVVLFIGLRIVWPRYDSVVTFQVFPASTNPFEPDVGATLGPGGEDEMEQFMETQVFVMRSEKILKRLLEDPDVQMTRWASPFVQGGGFNSIAAFDEVEDIVGARRIPRTNILMLRVRTQKPEDAKVIADTAADIYLSDVASREVGEYLDLKSEFESNLAQLRANVSRIDRERENLLGRNTITALQEANSVQLNEVRAIQPELVEVRSDLAQLGQMLETWEEMQEKPGGAVFPETLREEIEADPIIKGLDGQIAESKAQLRALEENGMANSQSARRLRRSIAGYESERRATIDAQLPNLFTSRIEQVRNQIDSLRADEAGLQAKLEAAQSVLTQTTQTLQRLDDLGRERERAFDRIQEFEDLIARQNMSINRPVRVRMLDSARIPDRVAFPRPIPIIGLSVVLIPGLVSSLIVLRELREQRIRGPQDVAMIPRTRVVGVIPDTSMDPSNPEQAETATRDAPGGVIAESFRQIRTSLLKDCRVHGHRSILVFAGMPDSGASTFVSNLAWALAETETRVLVIDANVRRPRLSNLLGHGREPGLSDVLGGRSTLAQAVQSTSDSNLSVLAPGKRDSKIFERFPSRDMGDLVRQAEDSYDLILIDAPPAVVSSDALALSQHCDASVMVARAYAEKRGLIARLRNQFTDSHAEFLGVVVNGVRASAGGYFKRNFQVTHEYGREAIVAPDPITEMPEPATNGTPGHPHGGSES